MEFPNNKRYNIILIDPAWTYKDKALAGNRGAGCKYNLMTTEDIKQLPINSIADDDCVLFCCFTFSWHVVYSISDVWESRALTRISTGVNQRLKWVPTC